MNTARETVADYLSSQILGSNSPLQGSIPLPTLNSDGTVSISAEQKNQAFYDPETKFPIIQGIRPEMVFGTGILHAPEVLNPQVSNEFLEEGSVLEENFVVDIDEDAEEFISGQLPEIDRLKDEGDVESFGIEKSQQKRPNSMGITALMSVDSTSVLSFNLTGSTYSKIIALLPSGKSEDWYRRVEFKESLEIPWVNLEQSPDKLHTFELQTELQKYLKLKLRWRYTKLEATSENVIALTFVAEHFEIQGQHDVFHFQIGCKLKNSGQFVPTSQLVNEENASNEEQEIDFLFRHQSSYARGHGTACDWEFSDDETVNSVFSVALPSFYQEIPDTNIPGLDLDMAVFAAASKSEVISVLHDLHDGYKFWIDSREAHLNTLNAKQQIVASRLLARAEHILSRISQGIMILAEESNTQPFEAFQIMNESMLLQQKNGLLPLRTYQSVSPLTFPAIQRDAQNSSVGKWYPFQIGFILMALPGIVTPDDDSREEVDLIFFPTGGGKTEAYLGLAAFTIALRRIRDINHAGVDVLMRYTLRLLTVQQFERTSGLITALEYLRRHKHKNLGVHPISIGVWLGRNTTPNTRSKVVEVFNARSQGKDENKETNPFVLSRCPWCGAMFGPVKEAKTLIGYRLSAVKPKTLRFICGDKNCEFSTEHSALPIWITDEDVYAERPSYVIGTVDKFARLTWVPEARALFNLNEHGTNSGLPPELIIQDELHLISGPLGSMVGLYEAVIEELCSYLDPITNKKIKPKIIASTATTRNYVNQIKGLYGRDKVTLFPQAVDRSGESFFASVKKDENGVPEKGTRFLGFFPSTYVTGQLASSQVAAILSQAPLAWTGPKEAVDYYSTSLWFFNSLKELGQTLTLMQSTVVALLRGMRNERRIPFGNKRYIDPLIELTGRVSSDEISRQLDKLKIVDGEKDHVNTCLASSIMEVGVDVQRLGLLTINSQPKLTSQYIQVAGRVGRSRKDGPGLVIALYNASRSRDRSVYENFTTFHRRLYASVEPLSVTPFAIQTLEKGLIGAVLAHYRMTTPITAAATAPDELAIKRSVAVFRNRFINQGAEEETLADFENRIEQFKEVWEVYEPTKWEYSLDQQKNKYPDDQDTALLRGQKEPLAGIEGDRSMFVPNSMRTVDGQTNLVLEANPYSFQQQGAES